MTTSRPRSTRRDPVEERLHRAMREDCPRILSILAARFGDLDLADDAVQDAMIEAVRTWPRNGVPANVGGWLMTTARRRATDRLRAARRARDRVRAVGPELEELRENPDPRSTAMIDDTNNDHLARSGDEVGARPDERLRLLLLCCHPALKLEA